MLTKKRKTLPRNEQETIIQKYRDTDTWHVYTCDEIVRKQLDPILHALGVSWERVDEYGVEVELPKSCVRFYKKTLLNEARRASLREQGKVALEQMRKNGADNKESDG
jgi:hypothetical protein